MNKRQAMRIALATEASYLLLGAQTCEITDNLSPEDQERFEEAQHEMAMSMLKRAGFSEPMTGRQILEAVLGPEYLAKHGTENRQEVDL